MPPLSVSLHPLRSAAGRLLRLPPPVTRRVDVHRGVEAVMRDGTRLRADHYAPRLPGSPTVLIRTPYPRGGPLRLLAAAVAERGFHVVVQSCRGTGDSEGVFEPLRDEGADGLDTLTWLVGQAWHDGRVCPFGPSYAGFTAWAVAVGAGDRLAGVITMIASSDFGAPTYAGGAFSLDSVLTWTALIVAQRARRWQDRLSAQVELRRGQPRLHSALAHLPLPEADRVATGERITFYQDWLRECDPDGPYWRRRGHADRLAEVRAPVFMVGGWHDIFLPWQLADYAHLRAAGAQPRLVIGPWTHGSPDMYRTSLGEALMWLRAQPVGSAPVRIHVGGADEWRDLPDWPPPGIRPSPWYLGCGGRLATAARGGAPPTSGTDRFRYDPADPTPALGGPRLIGQIAGRRDNRELEARPDVLTYTSAPLAAAVEVLGPVSATVYVRADRPHFDVFVRLCDVDERGRSWNVCDGLTRVTPQRVPADAAGVRAVAVALWPAAHRFAAGHRIRVQVSGGAHPRFARNPGTGARLDEPVGPTALVAVVQEVLATGEYPSAVHLSVPGTP